MLTQAETFKEVGKCVQRSDSVDMVPSFRDEFGGDADGGMGGGDQPRNRTYLMMKTATEWLIALVLFVATAPLMLVLAAAIKLTSPGPVFYAQTRLGRRGRTYRILKLRSMVHNAEAKTGAVWAAKGDSRITKIGSFLRKTHLDELPQLLNVLCGEMGLIGPRPERPEIARRIERHVPGFSRRLAVRPGITGLAQMLLPADDPTDTEYRCVRQKLGHDLYYVRELSLLLDLRIAVATPCYFIAATIDSVRASMLGRYRRAVEDETSGEVETAARASAAAAAEPARKMRMSIGA